VKEAIAVTLVVVVIAIISLAALMNPLRVVWALGHNRVEPADPRTCRICYLALLCPPVIEACLGVIALGMGLNLVLEPGIHEKTEAAMLVQMFELAPQQVWAIGFITMAFAHFASLAWDTAVVRLMALLMSVAWWAHLTISAWPLTQSSIAFGQYFAISVMAVLALWGFSLERGYMARRTRPFR
jgi:hypothetical protein